ncbi:MAG TPA: metalloregulator ArsR/SmtB family transcription factor [Polyangiales bacterium]|nr:metalloregulator ArsR/SmtB family transcription factor [Polyangiales bacterium]
MASTQTSLDQIFQALSDPARRSMIDRLSRGPATVSELAEPLEISLPSVMQHLQLLTVIGLIRSDKVGRVRTCRIEPGALQRAEQWLTQRRSLWERRFDRLGEILGEPAEPPAPKKRKR